MVPQHTIPSFLTESQYRASSLRRSRSWTTISSKSFLHAQLRRSRGADGRPLPGGDITSESGGAIISETGGGFVGISIWHDGIGMSLYAKRLERGRFIWPSASDGVISLTSSQLACLLEGIDWRNPQPSWRPMSAG